MSGQTKLVLATDLTDDARPAAQWAHHFGQTENAEVILVHVVELSPAHWMSGAFDYLEQPEPRKQGEQRLQQWYKEVTGAEADGVELRAGNAAVQIGKAVRERGAELLVVSRSGKRGWERFVLGSRARALATEPPCELIIVHPDHGGPKLEDIVVGIDFSPSSERALTVAAGLARRYGAKLHLVHSEAEEPVYALDALGGAMIPVEYRRSELEVEASERIQALEKAHAVQLEGVEYDTRISHEEPARALIDVCQDHGSDLVVVGRAGHSPVVATVLGSTVNRLLQAVPTNLAICPTE